MTTEFADDNCFDNSGKRQELGHTPPLARVEEIRQDTARCNDRKTASEEVWNDVSHVPIGQLACRYSVNVSHVRWQNVKTADVAPRTALLPVTIVARPPEAARVDYALILEPSHQLQAALPVLEPLPGADGPSWAPILMAVVVHCPFASVIETKKSGGDPRAGEYQIEIWVYAMFERLRLLLDANGEPDDPLPCLPLFIAEGETCEFYIASQGPDKRTVNGCASFHDVHVCAHLKQVIWTFDEIGKAVYRKGIYQIIAVQQVVYHLAHQFSGMVRKALLAGSCVLKVMTGNQT